MHVLKPGIDFKLPEKTQEKVIEEQPIERDSKSSINPKEWAIAKVTAIKEQAAALGWQGEQLERLTVIIKACPCEIGHICRQSIQLHMVDNDGNFRGSSRFYNMRVNQPWFQHREEE